MPSSELLTTSEAAQRLGMSTRTINRYASQGLLVPATMTPGGHRRWELDDLRQQLRTLAERERQRRDSR